MLNEQIKSLLGEDTISEDTAQALVSLIEAAIEKAVSDKAAEKDAEKEEALKEKADEIEAVKAEKEEAIAKADQAVKDAKDEVEKRVDEAIAQATERFLTESKEQFVALDRLNRTEKALEAIKGAFEINGFTLNENLELDQTKARLEEAVAELETAKARSLDLEVSLLSAQCSAALTEATADLAETQKEKVSALVEGVEVSTIEEYRSAIEMIVEQVKSADQGSAPVVLEEGKQVDARMKAVLALLSK